MMRRTLHWYISALLLVLCLSGVSAAQNRTAAPPKPSISFTDIPPYDCGGPDKRATLSGTVSGVSAKDYRLVVYSFACNGVGYVQPSRAVPYVEFPRGTFYTQVYLGQVYWVAVAKHSYEPKPEILHKPEVGGDILAIFEVEGRKK